MAYPTPLKEYDSYLFSSKWANLNNYFYRSKYNPVPKTFTAKIAQAFLGYPLRRLGQSVLSRIVGVFFAAFLAIDCSRNTAQSLKHRVSLVFAKDPSNKLLHRQSIAKCERAAKLLLLSIPTTVLFSPIVPDIVSRHYVPNQAKSGILEAGGKFHYAMGTALFPKTAAELLEIVKAAKQDQKKVTVIGAGFSQSGDTLPTAHQSTTINLSWINQLSFNEKKRTITAGAGATWIQVMEFLNPLGYVQPISQASPVFSVGGSIGVNCHGWSPESPLVNSIQSLKIITAQAEIVELFPQDELFQLVVGGHGMFGIIVEATLKVVPNVILHPHVEEIPLEAYAEKALTDIAYMDAETDMLLGRLPLNPYHLLRDTVMHVTYRRNPFLAKEGVKDTTLTPEPSSGFVFTRVILHIARTLKMARVALWNLQKKAMGEEKATARNILMNPEVLCAFDGVGDAIAKTGDASWLQEYFVLPEYLPPFTRFLGQKLQDNNVRLFNASIRYVKGDKSTKLPYAPQKDHFAIVLFFHQALGEEQIKIMRKWVREVIDELIKIGGTFYLPYARLATRDQFEKVYNRDGRLDDIKELKKQYDPEEMFYSQFYEHYLASDPLEDLKKKRLSHLKTLAANPVVQNEFRNFLSDVLFQLNPDKFYSLIADILSKELTYEEAYGDILKHIHKAKKGKIGNIRDLFQSIAQIKKVIGCRVMQLMGKGGTIQGVVEIGSPGRNIKAMQEYAQINFEGDKIVVSDQERLSDFAQTGIGKRPYTQFIALGDYHPLTGRIKPASVEMVICTIGLHHLVKEKLQPFIESIKAVLKPGGSFILRDHDVRCLNSELMAELAHTVFNLANGISFTGEEGELHEVRHFNSIQNWIIEIEKQGFKFLEERGRHVDDTSQNTLIRFIKLPENEQENSPALETLQRNEGRIRPLEQTFYTTLEWHLVHVAEEYADFLKDRPVKDFPFFQHVSILIKAFMKSIARGRKANPALGGLFSEYMMMNYFMLFCTTPELLLKALVYAPLRIWPGASESHKLASQKLLLEMSQKYAQFIETTPSYQFPQKPWILAALKNLMRNSTCSSFFLNTYINATIIGEAIGKLIALTPIERLLYSDRQIEKDRIYSIVEAEPEAFQRFCDGLPDAFKKEIDVKAIAQFGKHHLLETTRYYPLRDFLISCACQGIKICSIAGQKQIQLKIKASKDRELWKELPEASLIQIIDIPTHGTMSYHCLDVKVERLLEILPMLVEGGLEITYIHDF